MKRSTLVSSSCLLLLTVAAGPGAADPTAPVRVIGPASIAIAIPGGGLERPAVEFNHAAHVDGLMIEGCAACHTVNEDGFDPALAAVAGIEGRERLTDAYHDACTGCHQRMSGEGRTSGPVTCGECHVQRSIGVPVRFPMSFDLSLHGRHSQAFPDECGTCHHIWDEATENLVHRENTEEACRGCHGDTTVEKTPSLRVAVHSDCVGCHLERADRAERSGPTRCVGCHDEETVAAYDRLDPVPRLLRGQPNSLWVKGPGAIRPMVAFNHSSHEMQGFSCSACHHDRLKACADCHTLRPNEDGGGINLERAHHDRVSSTSCVGCHRSTSSRGDCAGCHRDTTVATSSVSGCVICHSGPRPEPEEPPPELADGHPLPTELPPLPPTSDDLPEEVTIDVLVDQYQASTLPHLKIIRRLDESIRSNPLARRFHGTTEAMCAGCHHHSPAGERPPACSACHGDEAAATTDRPSLKVAYHRQCVRCHQRLEIKAGCTDCHAAKEGQS
jgi:hypothetical protein